MKAILDFEPLEPEQRTPIGHEGPYPIWIVTPRHGRRNNPLAWGLRDYDRVLSVEIEHQFGGHADVTLEREVCELRYAHQGTVNECASSYTTKRMTRHRVRPCQLRELEAAVDVLKAQGIPVRVSEVLTLNTGMFGNLLLPFY